MKLRFALVEADNVSDADVQRLLRTLREFIEPTPTTGKEASHGQLTKPQPHDDHRAGDEQHQSLGSSPGSPQPQPMRLPPTPGAAHDQRPQRERDPDSASGDPVGHGPVAGGDCRDSGREAAKMPERTDAEIVETTKRLLGGKAQIEAKQVIDAMPGVTAARLRSMFSPAHDGMVFVIGNRWGPARIRKFIGSGRAKIARGAPAGPHASWVGSDKQAVAQVDAGEIDTQAPPQPRAAKLGEISPQQQAEALSLLKGKLPNVGDEKTITLLEFNHVGRRRILRAVAKLDRHFKYDEAGDVIRRVEK